MTQGEITQKARSIERSGVHRKPFSIDWISISWRLALLYLAAITVAEVVTNLINPQVGLFLHGLVLMALLLHASRSIRGTTRRFMLAMALTPLIRLLSLAMPLLNFPLVYWYLVIGAQLFLAIFIAARVGNLSRAMLGLTVRKLPFQTLVSLSGILLGIMEYKILTPEPLIAELRLELIWLPALILLVFTGLLEELIFRGLLQYSTLTSLGRAGMVYTAGVFAVLHLGYRSWLDLVFVFSVALFFGWVVRHSGSILGVSVAHGLINIGLFLVFPFLLAAPALPSIDAEDVAPVTSPQVIEMAPPVLLAPVEAIPTPLRDRPQPALSEPLFGPLPTHTPPPTVTAQPTLTPTATPCSPQPGWVQYEVQPGDQIETLSPMLGMSWEELRLANCLDSDELMVGQLLWVPFLPATPAPRPTAIPLPTMPPATATWPQPTVEPSTLTPSPSPMPTNIPPQLPTNTPPFTPTLPFTYTPEPATLTPTLVPTTEMHTPTVPPEPTEIPSPTEESQPTPVPTSTSEQRPTEIPSPTVPPGL